MCKVTTFVYLIHFDEPLKHARHYIGFTQLTVEERFEQHVSGKGARLTAVVAAAGIPMRVVRVWPGESRSFERKLKNSGGAAMYCPECRPGWLARKVPGKKKKKEIL